MKKLCIFGSKIRKIVERPNITIQYVFLSRGEECPLGVVHSRLKVNYGDVPQRLPHEA